ncbi:glycosyltransferase [Candidatus Gottesmanbacteria bacterium]|nr:glycosyltransferase [Candidatus Gottesmanbacteria bacterium]
MIQRTFGIIIPVEKISPGLSKTIRSLVAQTQENFHIYLILTTLSQKAIPKTTVVTLPQSKNNPALKRNYGLSLSQHQYLLFLDDDIILPPYWLEEALKNLKQKNVSAAVGPLLTSPDSSIWKQISGYIWESKLMSLRFSPQKTNYQQITNVYDYPCAALAIKTSDFIACGGFNENLYPGEDTKLCLDITEKLKKKILYDPSLIAFHDRKAFPMKFLRQISTYATQRGVFVRKYPQTSLHPIYFLPLLFSLYVFSSAFFLFLGMYKIYMIIPLLLYIILLTIDFLHTYARSKNIFVSITTCGGIIISHFIYGIFFLRGLIKRGE